MFVALVDDDEPIRAAVSALLRAHGHDVRVFASGEEFLAAQLRPDCLVLDNRLPGMSGLEVHRYLERNQLLTPVVFITSSDDVALAVDALVARGAAIARFGKPFNAQDFLEAIERADRP
jgi:FixJ family two-component response regulator